MKLTARIMKDFFPDDNRFLHFVAKKNGLFFFCDEDVETARYFAIVNVNRMLQSEFEIEDKVHLDALMERNFKHAIYSMIAHNSAKKRSLEIRSESEFEIEGSDLPSILERSGEFVDPFSNELLDDVKKRVLETETEETIIIFQLNLEGYNNTEIAAKLNISPEAVRQRKNRLIRNLKRHYETNETNSKSDVQEVRRGIWSKPSRSNKAKQSDYSEAMSYLGIEA